MLNFNLVVIVYILLFHFSITAQTTDSFSSAETVTNYGLIFEKEIDYRLEDSSYTDVIQLLNLCDKAQAIQFRILINKAPDDKNNEAFVSTDVAKE